MSIFLRKLAFADLSLKKLEGAKRKRADEDDDDEEEESPTPGARKPAVGKKPTPKKVDTPKGTPKKDARPQKGPIAGGQGKKAPGGLPTFRNDWYFSPLEDKKVQGFEADPTAALEAYEALAAAEARIQYDRKVLKKALVDQGALEDSSEDEKGKKPPVKVNPFLAYAKAVEKK